MSDSEAELFLSGFEVHEYKKGEFIQEENAKCNIIRIILNGSARGFIVDDGKEITTNFYFEYDHAYDYVNYLLREPAVINIHALESVRAIEITLDAFEFLKSEVIGFHRMGVNLFKINYIKTEDHRRAFIVKSPKERYLDLLKNNKQIISRVPQHQVASYIGISAEHLSRIRKEIRDTK